VPEGDTLAKAAARLRPALAGHRLTRFEAPRLRGRPPAVGTGIEAVEARGKHLLVHFEGGLTLRTHLRMSGSWHLYRERERWQKPAYLARAVLGADSGWVAVCFQAPVVETFSRAGPEPTALAELGPDLCLAASLEDAVLEEVVARSVRLGDPDATLGEALLRLRPRPHGAAPRGDGGGPAAGLGHGGQAAPVQPRAGRASDPRRGPGRLRAAGPALPPLRHTGGHGPPR
jgi:endonuclease-8